MKKILSLLMILVLSIGIIGCSSKSTDKAEGNKEDTIAVNVTVDEAKKMIDESKELLVLDVRSEEDFAKGHLKDSKRILVDELDSKVSEIEQYKDKEVLVYCNSGKKSDKAMKILEDKGFTKLYHMNEGISKWTYDIEK